MKACAFSRINSNRDQNQGLSKFCSIPESFRKRNTIISFEIAACCYEVHMSAKSYSENGAFNKFFKIYASAMRALCTLKN